MIRHITPLVTSLALIVIVFMAAPGTAEADLYTGSGTTGFGGPIGGSTMDWTDDGTTVTVDFTKGPNDFNDSFVLYLDTGAAGRASIGTQVNDRQDANRSAISFMEASTGHTLTLPTGFEASHAISINTGFGGLWSIPASGNINNNDLDFVAAVGQPASSTVASFTFSFGLADLGLTPNSGAEIQFVGTYLNPFGDGNGLGFASNEGYGSGFPGGNIGQASFSFSGSALSYVTAVPEPSAFLFGGLVCCVLAIRAGRKR